MSKCYDVWLEEDEAMDHSNNYEMVWSTISPHVAFGDNLPDPTMIDILTNGRHALPPNTPPPNAPKYHNGFKQWRFKLAIVRFFLRYYASRHYFRIAQLLRYGHEEKQRFRDHTRSSLFIESPVTFYDWNFDEIYRKIRMKYDGVRPHQDTMLLRGCLLPTPPYMEQDRIRTGLPFEQSGNVEDDDRSDQLWGN